MLFRLPSWRTPKPPPKLIRVERMEPLVTEPQSISYESGDGLIRVSGIVHPTGHKDPRDGGFLIAKQGLVIEGLFDGVSRNRGDEAVKAAMDFLVPCLSKEDFRVTKRNVLSLLRECSQKMHDTLSISHHGMFLRQDAYSLTTLTLVFFIQNGRNWDSHTFVMGDSPAYIFRRKTKSIFPRKNSSEYENSVVVSTDPLIVRTLSNYKQWGANVVDPMGRPSDILKIVYRRATLTPGSIFMTVTDGISDNLELVAAERPKQQFSDSKVVDAYGFFEMAKLVLGDRLSDSRILQIALERMSRADRQDILDSCFYTPWDPVREYQPSGNLSLIRTFIPGKIDDAASIFRTEILY